MATTPMSPAPAHDADAAPDGDDTDIARQETERLVARYAGDAAAEHVVRDAAAEAYGRLADARVTAFVPVLVERSVRRRVI